MVGIANRLVASALLMVAISIVPIGTALGGPPQDKPAGPQSLPGDNLPPVRMLDATGALVPLPPLEVLKAMPIHEGPAWTAPGPSMAEATKMAQRVVGACKAKGIRIGVAVVDSAGHARATLSADGADGSHVFVAMRKAIVAQTFGLPNSEVSELLAAGRLPMSKVTPAMFVMPGALPIRRNGLLIGAIGVSGAAGFPLGMLDEDCARAAIKG